MKRVVTFGEVMLRLTPVGYSRIVQARSYDAIYVGAEANVAVTLANLGMPVDFVTRLPHNDLGDACVNYMRQFGVGMEKTLRGGDRLGIVFIEMGAVQRGNKVIYDRIGSAFYNAAPGMFDWEKIFSGAGWFHWTGITPAVSEEAFKTCKEAIKKAKQMKLTISCDLNYRSQLWKWGKTTKEVMSELVRDVDILIANEEDAEKTFDIKAPEVDVTRGQVKAENYVSVAKQLVEQFPQIRLVNFTLRGSISASHNTWSGMSFDKRRFYTSPTYDITHIVDRVGAGDAFSGGLIYGLLNYPSDLQRALDFAVATSCLKHTVYGDSLVINLEEIEKLMKGIVTGRISR